MRLSSVALNTRSAAQSIRDPAAVRRDVRLIFIACGDADGLLSDSRNYHDYLTQQSSHMYQLEPGQGHTTTVWKRSLYNFAQRIFRDSGTGTGTGGIREVPRRRWGHRWGANGGAGGAGGSGAAGGAGGGGGGTVAGTGGQAGGTPVAPVLAVRRQGQVARRRRGRAALRVGTGGTS